MRFRFFIFAQLCALAVPAFALALCVTQPLTSLRAGPGSDHRVTWIVGQYMPLKEITRKGSWIQVQDMDGEKHWVASAAVSSRLQCVAVKSKIAKLRKGPGSRFPESELATADKYTPFLKVNREGDWIQVQDEYRETFWVSDKSMWWPVTRMTLTF